MSDSLIAPTVRISDVPGLLSVVPVILGHYPAESIVLVCVSDSKVGMTARVDLPSDVRASDWREVSGGLVRAVVRVGAETVFIFSYGTVTVQAVGALNDLTERLEGVRTEAVVVQGQSWRHVACDCCPPGGRVMVPPESGVARELMSKAGFAAPLESRQAMAAQLEPGARSAGVGELCAQLPEREDHVLAETVALAWSRVLLAPGECPDSVYAWAGGGLARLPVEFRDDLIAHLVDGLPTREDSLNAGVLDRSVPVSLLGECPVYTKLNRLISLCQALPPEYAAGPLMVLACCAFAAGQGGLSRMAVTRVLEREPEHRLAGLLDELLCLGIQPWQLR